MSCNMWVYNGYLYLGTYNDPMLDLAEIPASGNFELLYNDLDHSIYLYRMDADGNFQQVAGKDDNPYFPDGPSATWARVWATTPTSISGATASTTVSCTSAPMTPPL